MSRFPWAILLVGLATAIACGQTGAQHDLAGTRDVPADEPGPGDPGRDDGEATDVAPPPDAAFDAVPETTLDVAGDPTPGTDTPPDDAAPDEDLPGDDVRDEDVPARGCGGWLGQTCSETEYCDYQPDDMCGAADASSVCRTRPTTCTKEKVPVCGCDGTIYTNACLAHQAGTGLNRLTSCGGEACVDLERRVDEALAAVDACGPAAGCVFRELGPVCGSLSCRQVAVAADASTEGLAALDALGGEGMSKGCPGFHCGCDYLGVAACADGRCRLLPPGDDCQAVKDRFDEMLADPATRTCGTDADCAGTTVTFAPFCTAECACAVVTNQAAAAGIRTLSSRWQALGCPIEDCACTKCATVVQCVEGQCKGRL